MPVFTVGLLKNRRGFTRPVHIFNPSTAVDTRHCNRSFPIWYRYNLRLNLSIDLGLNNLGFNLSFNLGINLGSNLAFRDGFLLLKQLLSALRGLLLSLHILENPPNGRMRDIDTVGAKLMSNINTRLLAHWTRANFGKDFLS
jgi:hypothetical protein